MTWPRLLRSELRKLTTTKMPWAFLAVLAAISAMTATAVVAGTDFDGSKDFLSTAADQRSLIAFAANATVIAGLFGAMAVAREYAHGTVIPTFLTAPRRHHAVLAQFCAVGIGGVAVGFAGAVLTVAALALALPTTEFGFMVATGDVVQVIAASSFAGGVGGVLGAGIGAVVRNTGGAVTGAVLALIIAPPLIVQLVNEASSWVPSTLATAVLSGVPIEDGSGAEVGLAPGLAALAAWAIVPAAIGLLLAQRRDVA